MKTKTLIDVWEAASLLSLKKRQVDRLVRLDQIPHIVLPNGEVRFNRDDFWEWADSLKREVATQ